MDTVAMNTILDSIYGPGRAAGCPDELELALIFGDPRDDGVEITGGGYGRVTVDSDTNWEAAVDGAKATDLMTFPDTTGEWTPNEATNWALYDGTVLWSSGRLAETLVVTGVGLGPRVRATVRIASSILPDED